MSYCRNNGQDSDVYVIATANGRMEPGWSCCGCDKEPNFFPSREGMVEHLLQHRTSGDKVPERALERLRQEIDAG
jgi:hypothetical protein